MGEKMEIPGHSRTGILLRFFARTSSTSFLDVCDGGLVSRWLNCMSYFHPFLKNENQIDLSFFSRNDDTVLEIPVPCSKNAFVDLLYLAVRARASPMFQHVSKESLEEHLLRPRSGFLPDENNYSAALKTADKLGLELRIHDYLREEMKHGILCFDVKMARMNETRWRATSNAYGNETLEDVDDRWASDVKYVGGYSRSPLQTEYDATGLFFGSREGKRKQNDAMGDQVIVREPLQSVMKVCDDRVLRVLRNNAGRLCLAGGSPLGMVTREGWVSRGNDYDLFLIVRNEDEANDVIHRVLCELTCRFATYGDRPEENADVWIQESSCAITAELTNPSIRVQLILRRYNDVETVINGFDFDVCKIGVWCEDTGPGSPPLWRVRAAPSCKEALALLTVHVNPFSWGSGTLMRCIKYFNKGFDVVVPGMKRELLERYVEKGAWTKQGMLSSGSSCHKYAEIIAFRDMPGLVKLFLLEKRIIENLVTLDRERHEKRASNVDVDVIQKIYSAANSLESFRRSWSFSAGENLDGKTSERMASGESMLRNQALLLKEVKAELCHASERDPNVYVHNAARLIRTETWDNVRTRVHRVMELLVDLFDDKHTIGQYLCPSFYESNYNTVSDFNSLPPYAFLDDDITWQPRPIPAFNPDDRVFFPKESGWCTLVRPLSIE
mgnify:CR=1 FL=1